MSIKNIQELNFDSQRAIIGGYATDGCTCSTCECECTGNQKSNSIDNQVSNVKSKVSNQLSAKKF